MLIPQVVVLLGKAAEHLWKRGLLTGRSRSREDIVDGYMQSPLPVLLSPSWMWAAFTTCSHHHQGVALPCLPCHDELNPRKLSIKIDSASLKLFWLDLQKICTRQMSKQTWPYGFGFRVFRTAVEFGKVGDEDLQTRDCLSGTEEEMLLWVPETRASR